MAAIIRFVLDDNDKTGGCCTTVLVQNKIQIHQQKTENGIVLYMQ